MFKRNLKRAAVVVTVAVAAFAASPAGQALAVVHDLTPKP